MDDLRTRMRDRLPRSLQRGRSWFDIRSADDAGKATIRIYDEIGFWGITADDFVRQLIAMDADEIEVQLNSPGGETFDGIAIYNALRTHPARITTRVDGIAASAASAIVQAGDHRVMLGASQMMIHEAWGLAIGPAAEMRAFADLLDQQNDIAAGIYASRSGGDVDKFRELMAAETWLTDTETVELGLADEVVEPPRKGEDKSKAAATVEVISLDQFAGVLDQIREQVEKSTELLNSQTPAARQDPTPEDGVSRDEAERLLASLTFKEETS